MSENYTRGGEVIEYIKDLSRRTPITTYNPVEELLGQIVGELAILNGTLGKIERAMTGGDDNG